MCIFVSRTAKILKVFLALCACRDVLFTFGVWFYGHWLFDVLVGFFLFVHFGFLLCEVVWFGFEPAIST